MNGFVKAFKEPVGVLYHGGALAYALTGYVLGIAGLFHSSWLVNLIAILWLGHAMTIAAYLIHECGHNTIFWDNTRNARLGRFLNWITGSAYGTFEDIRYKHFRHHVDNDDSVWFDYEAFFNKHPTILKIVESLEWFYIPAHDLIMHIIMMFSAFIIPQRRDQRLRNTAVLLIRGAVFFTVLWFYPQAALLYCVAYMIMMQILRFMDSLQHDYGPNMILFSDERPPHKGDKQYEQVHTFSNPQSFRFELPNWLTLNFGYHNAHHARPTTPWYRLPQLHRKLFGENPDNTIPFRVQAKIFHTYRVARVMHWDAELGHTRGVEGHDYLQAAQQGLVTGGNAASFLTSF